MKYLVLVLLLLASCSAIASNIERAESDCINMLVGSDFQKDFNSTEYCVLEIVGNNNNVSVHNGSKYTHIYITGHGNTVMLPENMPVYVEEDGKNNLVNRYSDVTSK